MRIQSSKLAGYCRMQQERMEVVKEMLQQREVDHHALNSKRMEHLWYKIPQLTRSHL